MLLTFRRVTYFSRCSGPYISIVVPVVHLAPIALVCLPSLYKVSEKIIIALLLEVPFGNDLQVPNDSVSWIPMNGKNLKMRH